MDELGYYLGFSVFPGVGPKRFKDLLTYFGSAKMAWEGDTGSIRKILGNVYGEKFILFRQSFSFEDYFSVLHKKDVWYVALGDTEYPELLSQISNPPFVLYGKGDKQVLQTHDTSIGVVGTRRISSYGRQVTEMITQELVSAKCIIVSGLAMGVDAIAHRTTIENRGKTIAVLGSGVDVCHPDVNRDIYNDIIAGAGAVVSEYPLGEPPSKGSFPSRNRIIAGLSEGVVLTEGSSDSGALYTTSDALRNGRKVFAVPGPITSGLSKAPNSLLSQGATLVTSGEDILESLGVKGDKRDRRDNRNQAKGDTEEEQTIIDLLLSEELRFDEIVRKTGYDTSKTGMCLSLMELKGMISNIQGNYSLTT